MTTKIRYHRRCQSPTKASLSQTNVLHWPTIIFKIRDRKADPLKMSPKTPNMFLSHLRLLWWPKNRFLRKVRSIMEVLRWHRFSHHSKNPQEKKHQISQNYLLWRGFKCNKSTCNYPLIILRVVIRKARKSFLIMVIRRDNLAPEEVKLRQEVPLRKKRGRKSISWRT